MQKCKFSLDLQTKRKEKCISLTRQLSGRDKLIMDFLGTGIKVKSRRTPTLMCFIPAKMSVYLLLFAFSLKAEISLFFQMFSCSRAPNSSPMNWRCLIRSPEKENPKTAATAFPVLLLKKKKRQHAGLAWGQNQPLQTIEHKRTKTLSQGLWFNPPSVDFPCVQPLPVNGNMLLGLQAKPAVTLDHLK